MKTILTIILVSVIFALILNMGINKEMKLECIKWEEQEELFPDFYWTDWQLAQCKEINK